MKGIKFQQEVILNDLRTLKNKAQSQTQTLEQITQEI
jgi:hypothetical protein